MLFTWTRWLTKKTVPCRKKTCSRRRPTLRPQVEELETRLAPASFATLYSFNATGGDAQRPFAGLVEDPSGNLFGTTANGGANSTGAVFELVKSGSSYSETILHSFGPNGSGDGNGPLSNLILDANGDLFGTTANGGTNGVGAVFELRYNTGIYTPVVLYSFTGSGADGAVPYAGVIEDANGNFFGTTTQGGTYDKGTVYELKYSSGTYTHLTLYSFTGTGNDGAFPVAGLTEDANGDLFGTTINGGANGDGTVFELQNNSGSYTTLILHSFTGSGDGDLPYGGVIEDANGNLFGTTLQGGSLNDGTVFELKYNSGSYTPIVLHNFSGNSGDGALSYGPLVEDAVGNLFGTTLFGGTSGGGTVFEMENTSGGYVPLTLASFANSGPYNNGLVEDSSGNLFGTTNQGGVNSKGSVFEVSRAQTISQNSGSNQGAIVGNTLSSPLVVKVTDESGNPISGITVHWAATAGGSVGSLTSVSNTSGLASIDATLGTMASNTYTYTASVAGLTGSPVTFDETANPPIVVSPTTSTGLPVASVGSGYTQNITASGGAGGTYTFTTNDPLDGLTLSKSGTLGGSPTAGSSFAFTVTATDSNGSTGSQTYTLFVLPLPILTVNTTNDTAAVNPANSPFDSSGNISLRSAIQFADTNKLTTTIDFAADLGSLITLTSALPQITSNLTIQGPGADLLTVSGNSKYQVFNIGSATTDLISGLTISGGKATSGGGVYNSGGNLTLNNDAVSNNSAAWFGGGIFSNGGTLALNYDSISGNSAKGGEGGGTYNSNGNLTLDNDNISGNSASVGGGILNYGGTLTLNNDNISGNSVSINGGGIVSDRGTLTLNNDNISGNSAGGSGGGIYNSFGNLTFDNDTISGNTAKGGQGGGLYSNGGNLTFDNDTISGNSAGTKGGGFFNNGNPLTLNNDTISGNSASTTGGGIYNYGGIVNKVFDSIIDGNTAATWLDVDNAGGGTFTSSGGNLYGNGSNSTLNVTWKTGAGGDVADTNDSPGLAPLQDNGGPTQTMAELPGSPALGAGNTAGAPDTDQRGAQRVVNGAIDIGAFENQTQLFTLTPPASNPNPDIGIAASFNLGSFTESGSTGNPWTVTVNWGDGTPDSVFSANRQGTLPNQPHIYTTNTNSPYTVTVTVTDANSNFAQMTFQVTVNPPIVVSPTSATGLAIGTVGNSYSQTITASGGAGGTYTFTTTDPLDGLVLSTDGSLSGSPSTSGSFTFTVIATDSNGGTGTQEYTLTVNPALAITTTALPADTAGIGYSQQIAATGGSGSFTFIVSAGNLPAGLKLSSNGLLSGTPTSTNGSPFSFTIQVTDSNSITATQNYSLTINAGAAASIAVSVGSPQSTLANAAFAANLTAIVKDKYGNPVPNVTVLFAAPTTGPSGTFSGSVSVLTNSNGIAPAPTFTANLFAGTYTVTASTSGVNTPANFSLTNRSSLGSSANAIYVHNVYALLLSRLPDPGAQGWVAALNGGMAPATLVQDLEGSTEYLNDVVKGLYLHYLKRPADSGGLNAWTSALASGATIEQVIDGLVSSPEYSALHGNSNSGFVSGLYTDILNRTPSAGEVQSWVNVLNGGTTRAQAAMDFLSSTEYRIDLVDSYYLEYLRRPADSGGQSAWVNQLASGVSDQAVLAALLGSAEGYAKWS